MRTLAVILALGTGPADTEGWRAHVEALAAADDAESALRLAQGLGRRGDVAAALRWATEAERRGAHPLRVALARGDASRQAQDWLPAINAYFEVVKAAPEHTYAHIQLWHCLRLAPAEALARELDVARLRTMLGRAGHFVPERFSNPPERGEANARVKEGFELLTRGDAPGAIGRFHAAIARDPLNLDAWRGLGTAEARQGRPKAARAAYALYLSLDPPESFESNRVRRIVEDDARRRGLAAAGPK